MGTIVAILVLLLACTLIFGLLRWIKLRQRPASAAPLPFTKPAPRKLTAEERQAVERYLQQNETMQAQRDSTASASGLALTPQSENVYSLTQAITRYGLPSETPNRWRYYLDAVEVHLPPSWESFIGEDNHVEVIRTQTLPLIISLNGHTLGDLLSHSVRFPSFPVLQSSASIRQEENSEHVELLRIRKESAEEYRLRGSNGVREGCIISGALLLLFFSLIAPVALIPWLIGAAVLGLGWSIWSQLRRPQEKTLREIHCLRGTLKRWGVFGESNQEQISNISLGIIDLIYPAHWQAYLTPDLGKKTEVDIYLNRQVVRQGRYLSLHDEAKNFPLLRWQKSAILLSGSLLVLLLLFSYIPLSLPLKLSIAWLQGAQSIQATSVIALEKTPLHIGDILRIQGNGMCYVPPQHQQNSRQNAFSPFDCSGIYWNTAVPLPQPESETIDKASALLAAVKQQLHPLSGGEQRVNPRLASAIQKSGMILLDDFADIVLKTDALCAAAEECVRLKNALVNLGNAKNWSVLVKKAKSGTMKGINVLLRPVSAESLESIVASTAAAFFSRETALAIDALNSPSPGGFLLSSEEGEPLVSHPLPPVALTERSAPEQWRELQRLSGLLLQTPFSIEGIITNISTDANGTRHVALHGEPDAMTLWRYLGASLLLLLLCVSVCINLWLLLKRVRRNQHRLVEIQRYYDGCFNPTLSPLPLRPFF